MNGMINIYKEAGYTSHDVVAKLRGILKTRKIGHTGTLDPAAEGVLPVCVGNATGLCDMVADETKEYEAVLLLGVTTDTQDMTGSILQESAVHIEQEKLIQIIQSFVGEYEQIPPMYSAKKMNGQKLYDLARQGKVVERKPCHIIIHSIGILKIDIPRVKMRITCSKGTYIRTLCHDIGIKAECGAAMESLLRTRVGIFRLADSKRLSEVDSSSLIPVETYFAKYPALRITPLAHKWLYNGNILRQEDVESFEEDKAYGKENEISLERDTWFRMYDENGIFCAVYQYQQDDGVYRPRKMFLTKAE